MPHPTHEQLDKMSHQAYIISMRRTTPQPPLSQEEYEDLIRERHFPNGEDLLSPLEAFHSTLWDALLDAQVRTNEIVKTARNKSTTKWFYAQAMRFFVHNFMSDKGVEARLVNEKDEDLEAAEPDWDQKVLAGNGIAGKIKGYEYRLLKVFNGGLPPPVSLKRTAWYSQSHLAGYQPPLLPSASGDDFRLKPNLVYLWEIDRGKLKLYLAIPKHSALFASTPLTYIPNPITTIKAPGDEIGEEERLEHPAPDALRPA